MGKTFQKKRDLQWIKSQIRTAKLKFKFSNRFFNYIKGWYIYLRD